MKCRLIILLLCSFLWSRGQNAGGNAVYNFLRLPAGSLHTALGGENISVISRDITMVYQNPGLLRQEMHGQLGLVFSPLPAGVKQIHLSGGLHSRQINTSFAASVQYLDYGNISRTDNSGNAAGHFKPRDYITQLMAARRYGNRWFYGAAIKFIRSEYDIYRSSAIAMDIGVNYYDSSRNLQFGLVMKNMGMQLSAYTGEGNDNLPFDLQLGFTKRLEKAPLQFSVTARELHRLVLYKADSSGGFDHIMQHFVFAAQLFIADKIELSAGYNHLRRKELLIPNTANGLTGFSMGLGIILPRLQLRYARGFYSNSKGANQLGLNIDLAR
ncbi:type IX secretion system protein PorQ [Flavihumibacter stibioxidans]|uniref:Type IX secretion system protein PorQ n=1 Tax=Flavihumibacter stibioxidans TaxID=1834163 RepID=A0ABR7MCK2_9BACT|nr:type IX secretion system protein PorQ [Flavihumibacter stibioxidans]MBC6492234.1 hypothetical protein [Flavihumibacter stibioxidans]